MDDIEASQGRLLQDLERLLRIPAGTLKTTMIHATDILAKSLKADKVDAFLYDPTRDSLAAICSSNQPLSALEHKLGLEVLSLSNGGRVVGVYKQWQTFSTGRLHEDMEELRGVREGLGIKSKIGVPFEIGGHRRGMIMIASIKPDYFSQQDVKYAETMVRWIGILAHRAELAGDTRRHAMEQSRRAAADELVAVLAHDMRNYLAPLELRLQRLRTVAGGEGPAGELLPDVEKISKVISQLGALVSDLLDAARLDQGLFHLHPAALDVVALVQESASVLSRPGCNVDVRVQSIGEIIVNGDGRRLRQCVDNVIVNAVEQSPAGGTVIVLVSSETSADSEYAVVSVIDDGPGVPTEILPHIFERHTTGKAHRGGLGLGLFLAKRIAELHGGDLTVDSIPGSGATFRLSLPCQLHIKSSRGTQEAAAEPFECRRGPDNG